MRGYSGALLIIGITAFVVYVSFILRLARAFYSSSNPKVRALYWILPLVVGPTCVGIGFLGASLDPTFGKFEGNPVVAFSALLFGCYFIQFACWRLYIFRCQFCGTTTSTYRVSWRNGVYSCPGCKRPYVNGCHRGP